MNSSAIGSLRLNTTWSVFPYTAGMVPSANYGLGFQPSPPNNTWSTFTMGAVTPRGLIAPKIR